MRRIIVLLIFLSLASTGCQSMKNTMLEKFFGLEKRQLLKNAVQSVNSDQKEAQEEFKDALTRLKELYNFDGGKLESMYNKVKSAYEQCQSQATEVHERINNMESIAHSMFSEWAKEIKEYTNETFAENSRKQLADTKNRYTQLSRTVRQAESTMEPVLKQLNDHVLYLKHNLNAASIGALKSEGAAIQTQIEGLIQQMNASISQGDQFIQELLKS